MKRLLMDVKKMWQLVRARNLVWLLPVFFVLMPVIVVISLIGKKRRGASQERSEVEESGEVRNIIKQAPPHPDLVAENYMHNLDLMRVICEREGIRYIASLQPVLGIHTQPHSDYDQRIVAYKNAEQTGEWSNVKYYQAFYRRVIEHGAGEENILDLTGIFYDCQQQIYFDSVHFADLGQDIVAAELARIVLSK